MRYGRSKFFHRVKKILTKYAQCSESELGLNLTILRFLVFLGVVDFVLNILNELGTLLRTGFGIFYFNFWTEFDFCEPDLETLTSNTR